MTAILGKPQGTSASATHAANEPTRSGARAAQGADKKAEGHAAEDAVVRRNRTHDQALRTIGETTRFDNVDRNRAEGQDEDRRRLSTTEFLRGQSAIRI